MENKTKSFKLVFSLKNQKRNHFCYCYYYIFFIKSERAQFRNNRNCCKEKTETWKKRKKPSREESKSSHLDVGGLGEDEQVVAYDQAEGDPPSETKETQHRAQEPHRYYLIHHLAKQNQQGQIEEEKKKARSHLSGVEIRNHPNRLRSIPIQIPHGGRGISQAERRKNLLGCRC